MKLMAKHHSAALGEAARRMGGQGRVFIWTIFVSPCPSHRTDECVVLNGGINGWPDHIVHATVKVGETNFSPIFDHDKLSDKIYGQVS